MRSEYWDGLVKAVPGRKKGDDPESIGLYRDVGEPSRFA